MLGRLKFDIEPLVNEMLDQLPGSVWESDSTTFFDPAMGGGQFLREVVARLRACGHSDENIESRVYGMEANQLRVNYARAKGVIGQFVIGGAEDLGNRDMKFDVVLGNPPYQKSNEKGGASALWRKIVKKSWELVNEEGNMCFIVPQLPNSSKDLGHIFYNYQTEIVWDKISHHFKGVGSSFYAWIVNKKPKHKETLFINRDLLVNITKSPLPKDISTIYIIEKIFNSNNMFECKSSNNYYHTQIANGKNDNWLNECSSKELSFKLRRTSGMKYSMWGKEEPEDYYLPKVVFTFSGYPHYKYHSKNDPIGTIKYQSGHILVKDPDEADILIQLYESNLYKFVMDQMSSGGMRGKDIYEMPKVDLTRSWTDEELYAHFDLTQEEIDYIEATVK